VRSDTGEVLTDLGNPDVEASPGHDVCRNSGMPFKSGSAAAAAVRVAGATVMIRVRNAARLMWRWPSQSRVAPP